jgi:hypothetical protein
MRLTDALFYWLQLKLLADARPDDAAARDSLSFFAQILSEDHRLASFDVVGEENGRIYVAYTAADTREKTVWFDGEAARQMLNDFGGGSPLRESGDCGEEETE